MLKQKDVKYIVLSDIHLGHNKNPTSNIVDNLRAFFVKHNKLIKKLDFIFIAGDIFDRLLPNHSDDFILAITWLKEVMFLCRQYDIALRILEGTPGHDWKQGKVLDRALDKLNHNIDYKYIDDLYIEQNSKTGLSILYLPDEYKHSGKETFKEILKLLAANELEQVDIVIMHGQFHYQLPMIVLESSHTEADFLSIAKHYIHPGHIHTPSVYDRIIPQGSFDRLTHNEEEHKGCVYANIAMNGKREFLFLRNENAMIFKTLRFKGKALNEIMTKLNTLLPELPDFSNVRLIVEGDDMLIKNLKDVQNNFLNLDIKIVREKIEDDKIKLLASNEIESFEINRSNIKTLLFNELTKHNLTKKELSVADKELESILAL